MCKWCGSKQAFFDLEDGTSECIHCSILREAIERNSDMALKILTEIFNDKIKGRTLKWMEEVRKHDMRIPWI